MAWDRFGCAADCGTFPNTTTVNVTFFYSFLGDPNAEPVEWNLCNNDFKVCSGRSCTRSVHSTVNLLTSVCLLSGLPVR